MDAIKQTAAEFSEEQDPLVDIYSRRLHQLPQTPLQIGYDHVAPASGVHPGGYTSIPIRTSQ